MPKNICTQFVLDTYANAYARSIRNFGEDLTMNHLDALLAVISASQPGEMYPKACTGPKT